MTITNDLVETTGTVSLANGSATVTGTGTVFAGKTREANQLWIFPAAAAPYLAGIVAEVDPKGVYSNTSLPLLHTWQGTSIVNQPFALIDSVALASSAALAAVVARWVSQIGAYAGLVYNNADELVWERIQNNSFVVDEVTGLVYQWRGGVLVPLRIVGVTFNPRGAWDTGTTYAKGDLVEHGGFLFISNADDNVAHEPDDDGTPTSDANWTWFQAPSAASVAAAALTIMGLTSLTISTSAPVGAGTEGALHIQIDP